MNTKITLLNTKEKLFNTLLENGHLCTELESSHLFEVFEYLEMCIGIDQFSNLYKINIENLPDKESFLYLEIKDYCREECFIEILEDALFFLEADKEDLFRNYEKNYTPEKETCLYAIFRKIDILSLLLYRLKNDKLTFVTTLLVNDKLIEETHFNNLEDATKHSITLENFIRERYIVNKSSININTNIKDVLSFVNNPKVKILSNDINCYNICTYFKVI